MKNPSNFKGDDVADIKYMIKKIKKNGNMDAEEIISHLENTKYERRQVRTAVFAKALMLFGFEFFLMFFCMCQFLIYSDPTAGVDKDVAAELSYYGGGLIKCTHFSVLTGCVVSCMVIHTQIMPHIDSVFDRIGYLYSHSDKFE